MRLSVIIPAFNESKTLQEVLAKVRQVNLEKEILVINNGSTDETGEILEKERLKDPATFVVHTPVNVGKGVGVRMGLAYARGDVVVVQDADLELDPKEFPRLIEPILQGKTQAVYGSRFLKASHSQLLSRRGANYLANRFLTFLTNLLYGSHLTDMQTAYKMIRRDVLRGILLESLHFEFEPELTAKLLRLGHAIWEVPIAYHPRTNQEGKKIRWVDGLRAVFALLKYRFQSKGRFLRDTPEGSTLEATQAMREPA